MAPAVDWATFAKACLDDLRLLESNVSGPRKVYVKDNALGTARNELSLFSEKAVLEFVGNIKQEELWDHKQEVLRKDSNPKIVEAKPLVDSYSYQRKTALCYIAIYENPLNHKIVLKSLKLNKQARAGESMFNDGLLKQLGSLKKLGDKK